MKTLNQPEVQFSLWYALGLAGEPMSTMSLLLYADKANPARREWVIASATVEEALSVLVRQGYITFVTRRFAGSTEKEYRITRNGKIALAAAVRRRREEDEQRAAGNAVIRYANSVFRRCSE